MEACSCEKCRSLCMGNPGWFVPGQLGPAAEHLGMSKKKFFNSFLIVEYWGGEDHTYVLAPRRTCQDGQEVANFMDNFEEGQCRLLDVDTGCKLPYDLRPKECAGAYPCKKISAITRDDIKDLWKAEEGTEDLWAATGERGWNVKRESDDESE